MSRRFSLPAALAVLVAFSACGGSELRRSAFATRAEAAGAVPKWVPAASTNLETQVEEGTGAFWLRFRLPAADRAALEPELLRIPDGQVATLTFRAPKGVDWWFRGLVQIVPARRDAVADDRPRFLCGNLAAERADVAPQEGVPFGCDGFKRRRVAVRSVSVCPCRVGAVVRPVDPGAVLRVGGSEREKDLGGLTRLRVAREAFVGVGDAPEGVPKMSDAGFVGGEGSEDEVFHESYFPVRFHPE